MIKIPKFCRFFIVAIFIVLISSYLFAAEISLGVNYDNYNLEGKNTFGGSLNISEALTDKFSIQATLENKKNNNYVAYCAGNFDGKIFDILGGFLFDLRNGKFSPGVILNGDISLFNFITIGANTNFAFSTKNIFENYITEMQPYLTFHCKNQDISLIFDYSHTNIIEQNSSENKKKDYSMGGYLDVLALDERSPFKIGLFFGVESYKKSYDELYSVLDLNVGGRFIFDLEKFGFVVAGESTVYKIGEESPHTPFAISVTTRFSL